MPVGLARRLLVPVVLAAFLAGCSGDDPSGPPGGGGPRAGFGFDTVPAGGFVAAEIEGYRLTAAAEAEDDGVEVVVHDGDHALTDADNGNGLPATVSVRGAGQRLFLFEALDGADLLETPGSQPASGVSIRGYLVDEFQGVDYYGPSTLSRRTFRAGNLAGRPLTHLELEISSTGGAAGDDLAVFHLQVAPTDSALVDLDILPTGPLTHLFVGEFELTWPGVPAEMPELVEIAGGDRVLTDSVLDGEGASTALLERVDGGVFRLEAVYATDLSTTETPGTHAASVLRLMGFDGETEIGVDELKPEASTIEPLGTTNLAGVDLTAVRLEIDCFEGVFARDDFAVAALLVILGD